MRNERNAEIGLYGQTLFITCYAVFTVVLYKYLKFEWLTLPALPISIVGTAVAFYVGFKNNSAYDRTWEARKIWGGIVNSSRNWGTMVLNFVTDDFVDKPQSQQRIRKWQEAMIYRHFAWMYKSRRQL